MLSSPVKVADGTKSGFRLRGVFHFIQKKEPITTEKNTIWRDCLPRLAPCISKTARKRKKKKSTPFSLLWRTTANNNDNYMVIVVAALRMGLRSATDLPPLGKNQLIIVIITEENGGRVYILHPESFTPYSVD